MRRVALYIFLVAIILSGCIGRTRDRLSVGCQRGEHNDCLTLGLMALKGQDGRKDPQKALKNLVRSCELGNSIGCKRAGDMWENGVLGCKDPRKAEMYHQMARELELDELRVGKSRP